MSLSVVISAYNEESKIEDCLKSASFADEIIFIDNSSIDKTVDFAKKYTSKIFTRPNNPMLNINKNYGFTKASKDWILCLDADERVTPELAKEIKSKVEKKSDVDGYWIPRKNIIFGKWIMSEMWWPDYQMRLFKKGKGKFGEKHVHEYIKVDGETEKLNSPLVHENYTSVDQYLYKMINIYVPNEVKNRSGQKIKWSDSLRFPINDFLKTFFLQKGYKDGLHGLVLSFLQAFYMELVFVKLWENQGFEESSQDFHKDLKKEFKDIRGEFKYWILTYLMHQTRNPFKKIGFKVARKFGK